MNRIIKPSKYADYSLQKEWCLAIYDYLYTIDPTSSLMINIFRNMISEADKTSNMKIIKEVYQETNLMAREVLTQEQIQILNSILEHKFSCSIADEIASETSMIEIVIKRGRIINNAEYEIVKRREEEIYDDVSQVEYAEKLRDLMAAYGIGGDSK